jgi:hypothetical protein
MILISEYGHNYADIVSKAAGENTPDLVHVLDYINIKACASNV